ncbi:MAG: hypothetical protein CM15mP12_2440 [Gammaproteobacteria bacterium]|nr:MAG: hypothetical protein CM15mP12_2440 [Gammaproteobacteria bacterium]
MSDYKVKDINLAEFGRQEILLAQDEMPSLMQLRERYRSEQPLKRGKNCWMYSYDHSNCCLVETLID